MTATKTLEDFRSSDVFDSRDVIERIEELEGAEERSEDEAEELATLQEFADDASSIPDWPYGETFIRDSYFEDYARDLAEDIGAIDPNASWPLTYIDWERAADALKMDYTAFELDGVTFWARS